MTSSSELKLLLAGEIQRRLSLLGEERAPLGDIRAAMHSLKGSAAMAGESELALVLGQLGKRMRNGDWEARCVAAALLEDAKRRLEKGEPAFTSSWPEPPPQLAPAVVEAEHREEYLVAMRDRIDSLAELLQSQGDAGALRRAYGLVHGMKGAAASMGDDVTAWFCHGLEGRLKFDSDSSVASAWTELGRRFSVLSRIVEAPSEAVDLLRTAAHLSSADAGSSGGSQPSSDAAPLSPGRPSSSWPPLDESLAGELLRVPSATLEQFLEHSERIELLREELVNNNSEVARVGSEVRELRGALLEALRLIGPPLPWGVPAAALSSLDTVSRGLASVSDRMESNAEVCRANLEHLRASASEIRVRTASLQRTSIAWLFDRARMGIEQIVATEERVVRVETKGNELTASRRVIERLHDPVMQLARNSLAHGLRSPEWRSRHGKNPIGTIQLGASRVGDWLQVTVEDDGEGVDLDVVRRLAVSRGVLRPRSAQVASEGDLLGLLFLPGMTTKSESDMLAGRGIGLDLTQSVVRGLGGSVRLARREGHGIVATIRVPAERGVVDVLWVQAGSTELGIPVSFTGPVTRGMDPGTPSLARILGADSDEPPRYQVTVQIPGVQGVGMGVTAVHGTTHVNIRPVPATIASAGPYSGVALRPDGSLRLILDAALLAAQLWTHSKPEQ